MELFLVIITLQVSSLDGDTNRAMVKMKLGGETSNFSQMSLRVVSKDEYKAYSACLSKFFALNTL